MNSSFLYYNKNNGIIFLFSIFIIYSIINTFNQFVEESSLFHLSIQKTEGQLQQQPEIDYIKYQYQSDFIKEFKIPVINNNETGLKGITTDSENNVWFYFNTNT